MQELPVDGEHEVAVDRAPAGRCVSHQVGEPCCTSGEGGEGAVAGESDFDDSSWASDNYNPKGLCLESCDEAEGNEATEAPHDELLDAEMDRSATVPVTPRVGLVPASKCDDAGMPSPEARALSPGETRPSDPGQAQQGDLSAPDVIFKANADLAERLRKGVSTADADRPDGKSRKAPMASDVESPPVTDELRRRESFILKTLLSNSLETKLPTTTGEAESHQGAYWNSERASEWGGLCLECRQGAPMPRRASIALSKLEGIHQEQSH